MTASVFMMLAVLGLTPPPADPSALVRQLGAPRFAEREAASRALEALGAEALPALRAARAARDPEIRARATVLHDQIEKTLILQPTLVALDFEERPLLEIVQAIRERTDAPLVLWPDDHPTWRSRTLTLQHPEPVLLWQALDLLGETAGVQLSPVHMDREPVLRLTEVATGWAGPDPSYSGPFKITLVSLQLHRQVSFMPGGTPLAAMVREERLQAEAKPAPAPRPRPRAEPTIHEQFSAQLQILAEPRLKHIRANGPVHLIEAVDDREQSLRPEPSSEGAVHHMSGYFGVHPVAVIQVPVTLKRPEQPGTRIGRLRGTVPVVVASRRGDPLVIPLEGAEGRTVRQGDRAITIHQLQNDPNANDQTLIELTVREGSRAEDPAGPDAAPGFADSFMGRPADLLRIQLEVVDAQGRSHQWFPQQSQTQPDEIRVSLRLLPTGDRGVPVELRYYDLLQAATEVAFDFTDIPMP